MLQAICSNDSDGGAIIFASASCGAIRAAGGSAEGASIDAGERLRWRDQNPRRLSQPQSGQTWRVEYAGNLLHPQGRLRQSARSLSPGYADAAVSTAEYVQLRLRLCAQGQ